MSLRQSMVYEGGYLVINISLLISQVLSPQLLFSIKSAPSPPTPYQTKIFSHGVREATQKIEKIWALEPNIGMRNRWVEKYKLSAGVITLERAGCNNGWSNGGVTTVIQLLFQICRQVNLYWSMRGGRKNASFGRKLVLNLCNLGHVELSIIVIISLDSVYHHFPKTHTSSLQQPTLRPSFKVSNNNKW